MMNTTTKPTPIQMIDLSVPLLIRLLEFAREDSKSDRDLHFIAEYVSQGDRDWTMRDYDAIIASIPPTTPAKP